MNIPAEHQTIMPYLIKAPQNLSISQKMFLELRKLIQNHFAKTELLCMPKLP